MSRIKKFVITDLFGYQNVNLDFDKSVMILMGENGLGKTSILNSLYYTLTGKWQKLLKINFGSIALTVGKLSYSFTKEQLEWVLNDKKRDQSKNRSFRDLRDKVYDLVSRDELIDYVQTHKDKKPNKHVENFLFEFLKSNRSIRNQLDGPIQVIMRYIEEIYYRPDTGDLYQLMEAIEGDVLPTIFYFPTYRRVEEELQNLGKLDQFQRSKSQMYLTHQLISFEENDEDDDETLIQFGMQDVVDRINRIIHQINESSIKGFAKASADILHQLQEGFPELTVKEINSLNVNNIRIILNRVEDNLKKSDRDNILELLDKGELKSKRELAYFLLKLQEIYLQQQNLDNAIKSFESVCNEYLVGKKVDFDESRVTLGIVNTRTGEEVRLSQLSSGEKQIVSLFSKIFLEETKEFMVFFDEPELSLSIKWQRLLLPHIMQSERCSFLLAVTHSPFIYDNSLSDCAVGMNLFVNIEKGKRVKKK